ncbi:centrosomal protein of 152 kDa-like isoform X2 [Haliotis rubra]|uniref:centrosomal protein of 152 kDa-like isoform X2 n=1 Tax=Haliotis rubra TaxID=36100 RepID=UPI001EE582FD|nr:centrosomal protein of 152 kDa-like isoform X2 [Haliotis rubra]
MLVYLFRVHRHHGNRITQNPTRFSTKLPNLSNQFCRPIRCCQNLNQPIRRVQAIIGTSCNKTVERTRDSWGSCRSSTRLEVGSWRTSKGTLRPSNRSPAGRIASSNTSSLWHKVRKVEAWHPATTLSEAVSGAAAGDSRMRDAQLLGLQTLQAVEAQVESLNTIREEYVKKLQTTETTLENLTHELSNLQQSDSLARALNQHEAVVSSMQQKFDKEVLDLKEKLDIANETINQTNSEISSQRQRLSELTHVSEKSQISRAETINRLTKSLEESQRRCQSLLETASSQEVSELKISLKQMTASQKMSSEMCDTLQHEVKELKEQLSMYESASTLGIFSNTQTRSGLGDDSMTDLGIRKTLDFSTPRSQAKFDGSQSSSELITSLKVELERCLTSNRQKRSQVSKIQEELREYKKEVKALRGENSQLEKLTGEQKVRSCKTSRNCCSRGRR